MENSFRHRKSLPSCLVSSGITIRTNLYAVEETHRTVTQKIVLSIVSTVYDPIGLVAPYTVKARLFLKDIWGLIDQKVDDFPPDDIVTSLQLGVANWVPKRICHS